MVFCYLRFPSGLVAHLHLSWLDPHKERRFTVVGSKQMATFDDMALEQKLTVYDKGFDQAYQGYGEYIARSGDVCSPQISERGAAADRVPALRGARARRPAAALRRRGRRARGAGAGGAARASPGRAGRAARHHRPGGARGGAGAAARRPRGGGGVGPGGGPPQPRRRGRRLGIAPARDEHGQLAYHGGLSAELGSEPAAMRRDAQQREL